MIPLFEEKTIKALTTIKDDILRLSKTLGLSSGDEISKWVRTVETGFLPRMMADFPLTIAICGGGSSGKSTLFNTLSNAAISPAGGMAGINRRILLSVNKNFAKQRSAMEALFSPFGSPPEPLSDPDILRTPGPPVFVSGDKVPEHLAVMDTPDFDTGSKGVYRNREMAEKALEASDILIYIFTNANYNNRDNTDFISSMLTGVGMRKCILVYRTYEAFSNDEVKTHASITAQNLYGENADENVLGIFRADEDNAVAAGKKFMVIRPVDPDAPSFIETLRRIDPRQLKIALSRSMLDDFLEKSGHYLDQCNGALAALALYEKMLKTAQGACVQEAMRHFPMDEVMQQFSRIWQKTDPVHIKAMRKTGKVVEAPLKLTIKAIKWLKQPRSNAQKGKNGVSDYNTKLETDLIRSAGRLYKISTGDHLRVSLPPGEPITSRMKQLIDRINSVGQALKPDGEINAEMKADGMIQFHSPAHPAVDQTRKTLENRSFNASMERILNRKTLLVQISEQLDTKLTELAMEIRSHMNFMDQMKQTFSAFLNIIPATAAVTYILHTGDPVGAVGIKVKLAGLFGLNDLVALVAIPATSGIKKADLKQLEQMLAPVAHTWLNDKLVLVQELFEKEITGGLFQVCNDVKTQGVMLAEAIGSNIRTCTDTMERPC